MSKKTLTISILSSGRGKSIERCLSSLAYIREVLPCEVIVVNTDSTHNEAVYSVLEQYADRIIPFTWCDDFSAARNVGVDAASGEWFLFIDDDEWFIDAQPVIDFLQSDEQSDYDRVNFLVRNYRTEDYSVYGDGWVCRLFRLSGGARFAGKVHEYILPSEKQSKNIHALLGHTGYIFSSQEEAAAHSGRNIRLMKQMMKEEPLEVRWILQLMMEYGEQKDLENELAMAKKAYQLMDGAVGYRYACMRGLFAADIVRSLRELGEYRKCYETYKRYQKKKNELGRVALSYMELEAAIAAGRLGGMSKQVACHAMKYINARCELKDAPVEHIEEYTYFLMSVWDTFNCRKAAGLYLDAVVQTDLDNEETFGEMVRVLWSDDDSREEVQGRLLEWRTTEEKKAAYWWLVRALANADELTPDPIDVRIIWDDHEGRREQMPSVFRKLFAAVNPLLIDPMLWEIGMRRGAALDERIAELPMEHWQAYVDEFSKESGENLLLQMQDVLADVYVGMGDERYAYFQVKTNEALQEFRDAAIRKEAEERVAEKREKQQRENADEMKQLIAALEKKVDDLVAAGMIDEADKVLREIQKYAPK